MSSQSLYMYSAGRIKALETTLLSEVNVERMLSSKDDEEFLRVLHDTFLSPYISDRKSINLLRAFRKCITNTKEMLTAIAPEPELLDILWVQYDYHNLKTILKGKRAGMHNEEIVEQCFKAGRYDIKKMINWISNEEFSFLSPWMRDAYQQATEAKEVYEIDAIINQAYFEELYSMVEKQNNDFVQDFVRLLVDLYNIRTALRVLHSAGGEGERNRSHFAPGGTVRSSEITTKEGVYEVLKRFGGEEIWKEPWQEYEQEGHFTMLERTGDDVVVEYLKRKSVDVFSVATLYAFFWARKNNVEMVKTIYVGKHAGLSEANLRKMLRRLYS